MPSGRKRGPLRCFLGNVRLAVVLARKSAVRAPSPEPVPGPTDPPRGPYLTDRQGLLTQLDELLGPARPAQPVVGLVYVGLDRFQHVNSQYGRRTGDLVLAEVAQRLQTANGISLVAALGNDEFALLARAPREPRDVSRLAISVADLLAWPPVERAWLHLKVEATVVSVCEAPGVVSSTALLGTAEAKMRGAKSSLPERAYWRSEPWPARGDSGRLR